jgi:hypothetical protein
MKREKNTDDICYPRVQTGGFVLKEDLSMVRTQVYLTRAEHEFLQAEAERLGEPMSAYLRRIIDEKMQMPDDLWQKNPMLAATAEVKGWAGDDDAAENHDAYIYGSPKRS